MDQNYIKIYERFNDRGKRLKKRIDEMNSLKLVKFKFIIFSFVFVQFIDMMNFICFVGVSGNSSVFG